jgi:hypothetical protein
MDAINKNVLFELRISELRDEEFEQDHFDIRLDSSFGVEASLKGVS